jgi:hypothetical protein
VPDIDLDVESERRLEVYDAIIKRFGKEWTAVTGMPETYRAEHALRFPVKFSALKSFTPGRVPVRHAASSSAPRWSSGLLARVFSLVGVSWPCLAGVRALQARAA